MARKRHISPLRNEHSLARRPKKLPTRPTVLIVCEGETEKVYFQAMRHDLRLNATVVIPNNTEGSAPISVVNFAISKFTRPDDYDHAYCVFDRDHHETFDEARSKIKKFAAQKRNALPLREAISIPCFEIWVLLHFLKSDSPFDSSDAIIRRLKDSGYITNYEKADANLFEILKERLNTALQNAEWLEGRFATTNGNPYTDIHILIRLLINLSKKLNA